MSVTFLHWRKKQSYTKLGHRKIWQARPSVFFQNYVYLFSYRLIFLLSALIFLFNVLNSHHHEHHNNILKAKDIGEGLFCSSRTVSGAIRKLITDGYVSKTAGTPVCYSLTDLGMAVEVIMPESHEDEESWQRKKFLL